MSHKSKKQKDFSKYRGDTFVGFRPKVEESQKDKQKKSKEKHKKDYKRELDFDNI